MNDFAGFPVSALDFYDDLEVDNTRSFWEAHKATYDEAVKAPMVALTAALEPEFGRAKVFRPHRDVRFAKDKTPYKTHQGAFVPAGESTGWYVEISARGTRVGAGYYEASGPRLAAITTHNEPWVIAMLGHDQGTFAPGIKSKKIAAQVKIEVDIGRVDRRHADRRASGAPSPLRDRDGRVKLVM